MEVQQENAGIKILLRYTRKKYDLFSDFLAELGETEGLPAVFAYVEIECTVYGNL